MSNCYSNSCSSNESIKSHKCPVNGKDYKSVSQKTVFHHISEPWQWEGKQQDYYFCSDPECDVVYFGEDGTIIKKSELRTIVGIKEKSDSFPICYCFGVSANQAATNYKSKEFVVQMTKEKICECETRNPSGKCCLKDFPKS